MVIGWNKQEDGTMGEAFAYNVELSDAATAISAGDLKHLPSGRTGFVLDPAALEGKGRRISNLATE